MKLHRVNWSGRPAPLRFAYLAAILMVLVTCFGTAARVMAQEVQVLRLSMGETEVVDVPFGLADVIVGNDEIASVTLLSSQSLLVTPLSAGSTQILLRDSEGAARLTLSVAVREDFAQLKNIIDEVSPRSNIEVRNVNGRALVAGIVGDEAEASRILDIARSYSDGDVIDALKVADPRQVMLKVNILELSRSAGKELGINTFRNPAGMDGTNGDPFGTISRNLNLSANGRPYSVDLLLQALETKGIARRLANPTLVAVNGSTASFVVGGEVPITTATQDGESTTYREYGVKLAFTPQVMDGRIIRLQIMPEVSEVDWSRRVNENPAFVSRKVDTTIELQSGESFAIAGLLQSDSVRSARQFPWMGNVPILGALFRSSAYQKNQTELVVVVTPHLVNGESPENIDGDPTLQSGDPDDAESFLLGAVEDRDEVKRRFLGGFGVSGPYGHILPRQ